MSSTDTSTDSIAASRIEEWDCAPCVQYGFSKDEKPARAPKLHTIFNPVPEGANTVSPVYLLTPDEYQRQGKFNEGYEVTGISSIGRELQETCEDDDRVLYPIHIESDEYLEKGPETLMTGSANSLRNGLVFPSVTVRSTSLATALFTFTSRASSTERHSENGSRSKQSHSARRQEQSWTLASTTENVCSGFRVCLTRVQRFPRCRLNPNGNTTVSSRRLQLRVLSCQNPMQRCFEMYS